MWALPCGIAILGIGVCFGRALRRAAQRQAAILAEFDATREVQRQSRPAVSGGTLLWTESDDQQFAHYVAQLRRG